MNIYSITVLSLVFLFGISIGSFLNVLIYRMGSGKGIAGRSKCLACGKVLTPLMLIPLFSFAVLRGRCGHCGTKLSYQYPLIEMMTGILFVTVAMKHALYLPLAIPSITYVVALVEVTIWSILVVIFAYDWKHKIIPDNLSLFFAICAGLLLYIKSMYGMMTVPFLPFLSTAHMWLHWAAAPIVAVPLALVWLLTGGRGMGLGDAKLAWGIGWFLGIGGAVSAVVFSFWIAFFPSLGLLFLRNKHFTMKSEIPFAPFLILGIFVAYVCDANILSWTF